MVGVSTIYRLVLVKPELNDYWYEKQCLEDPDTMSYNAGYDFSYGVDALYDGFEEDRASARHVFQELGFEIAERTTWNRFGTKVNGMTIVLTKDKFQKRGNR